MRSIFSVILYSLQHLNIGWRVGTGKIDLPTPVKYTDSSMVVVLLVIVVFVALWLLFAGHFFITKTYPYNFDPLKPHFYIVKLGFYRGIHYFSYFRSKNIDCGYSIEPPRWGGSNEYPQSMFQQKYEKKKKKKSEFLFENLQFLWWNFQYIWIGVFS